MLLFCKYFLSTRGKCMRACVCGVDRLSWFNDDPDIFGTKFVLLKQLLTLYRQQSLPFLQLLLSGYTWRSINNDYRYTSTPSNRPYRISQQKRKKLVLWSLGQKPKQHHQRSWHPFLPVLLVSILYPLPLTYISSKSHLWPFAINGRNRNNNLKKNNSF